ncbi:hypothetical protein QAD02_021261 [Eretmocerus hayati]|uniref:Uncharacterized protein n=1 Tax=Eretmocerus hayati TaxID=131215 RepID=A0ACC2PR37_9HYME|nr:hypothetical protein QAD02_021261 [Eretmocerus hayati]
MAQRVRWNSKRVYSSTGADIVGIASLAYAVQGCLIVSARTTGVSRLSLGLTGASAHLKDTECSSGSNMAQTARWNSGRAFSFTGSGMVGIASLACAVRECLIAWTRTTGESRLSLGLTGASAYVKGTGCSSGSRMAQRARWNSKGAYFFPGRVPESHVHTGEAGGNGSSEGLGIVFWIKYGPENKMGQ